MQIAWRSRRGEAGDESQHQRQKLKSDNDRSQDTIATPPTFGGVFAFFLVFFFWWPHLI